MITHDRVRVLYYHVFLIPILAGVKCFIFKIRSLYSGMDSEP